MQSPFQTDVSLGRFVPVQFIPSLMRGGRADICGDRRLAERWLVGWPQGTRGNPSVCNYSSCMRSRGGTRRSGTLCTMDRAYMSKDASPKKRSGTPRSGTHLHCILGAVLGF
jgi:hypothetical protein